MIIPVRCFTCGKVIGQLYEKYSQLTDKGVSPSDALEELKIHRYCCRRIMLTSVPLIDKLLKYPVAN